MAYKVYVDGQEGTTGLQINSRLAGHADIEILRIDSDKRRDDAERSRFLNEADIAILCLPDDAARQAVSMITNDSTRIIDASTAHRTAQGWAYGLPELSPAHRERVRASARVSVPGCYATGFNMIVYPLIQSGLMPADYPATCHAVSGYSGGSKKLIAVYEQPDRPARLNSPCMYALSLSHKHLPEMQAVSGLTDPPLFAPIVADYYKGMTVAVPIFNRLLARTVSPAALRDILAEQYEGCRFVQVMPLDAAANLEMGFLTAEDLNDTNNIQLFVTGNEDQLMVIARLDNLGKGSSGAAVQCLNIMLGFDEAAGL